MKYKPSRYQIAGIILSTVWVFVAGIYAHYDDVNAANNFVAFADKVCADSVKLNTSTPAKCQEEHAKNIAIWMKGDKGNVLILAFGPLPLFWLLGFCLLYFIRAQIAGFRAIIPWREFSRRQRAIFIFCVGFTACFSLFGLLVLLNAYVDSRVPVSPSLKSFYKASDGSVVEVVGTWTRTDLVDDTIANPIQTSRILCSKNENRCTEAKAYLSGNSLFADNLEYTLQSWTPSAIVLRNDYPCATEVYTIDLNTEVVSGAGYRTNKNLPSCNLSFNRDGPDHWSFQMEDGFKVYWNERQKRRPWLLRLMQTVLGN